MGLNPAWLVSLEELWTHRDTKGTRAQGKGHVRTQQESGHLQAKEGGLRRNQPCWHFDLVLLAPRTEFSSVTQLCPTLCDPMNRSTPGLPVYHQLPEFTQTHVHQVSDLILCCPLLLPPSIFPTIRVFSNEWVFCIRWPKYWRFSFNISPSNEHPGLISFRMDWFDLLAVQGTLKGLLQHHSCKASILRCSAFFIVQFSYPYMTTGKT